MTFWKLNPCGMQFVEAAGRLRHDKCVTADPDNEAVISAETSFLLSASSTAAD